ncbi:MAG: SdrD B-like domain-containing protein [Bacteroidia bacterium]
MDSTKHFNFCLFFGLSICIFPYANAAKSPVQFSSLSSKVWIDTNANERFDKQEQGLSGVTVRLISQEGILVAETVSDEMGSYQLSKIKAGKYSLHFLAPQGYEPKLNEDAFSNIETNNKVNILGSTAFFTLKKGEKLQDYAIPFQKTTKNAFNIYNCVWDDSNENERFDIGERALEDVTVVLYNEKGKSIAQTSTDKNGTYGFWGLKTAIYNIGYYYPANTKGATLPSETYGIISNQTTRPAKIQDLVQFKAESSNRQALLKWETEPTARVKYFELWRSTTSDDEFEELINVVSAQKGETKYVEYDKDANLTRYEKCYYRLKMVYEGGLSQWSEVLTFSPDLAFQSIHLMVYPSNDETDMYINYQFTENYQKAYLFISDAQGNKRYQSALGKQEGNGQLNVDISEWEQGTYQVVIKADEAQVTRTCIIP